MHNDLHFRFAVQDDLSAITEIYNQAIRAKNATGDLKEYEAKERTEWLSKYTNNDYPIYVVESHSKVVGYCTLSPYRPGRKAMSQVAEISYYLDYTWHRKGIGAQLIKYVIEDCPRINKQYLLAILLDINTSSIGILEKFKFKKWGHFPEIVNLDGNKCGHLIYGLKVY